MDKEGHDILAFDHSYAKDGCNVTPLCAEASKTGARMPYIMIADILDIFQPTVRAMRSKFILRIQDAGINKKHANNIY